MKLIGSYTSPYVRKVRIVLAEKRIECKFEAEDVWAADTKIQEVNPLGKVPCLIMEDSGAMFDSRVIVEYLDTLTPVGKLIPTNGRERAEVKCWEALGDGLLDACVAMFMETTKRPAEYRWPAGVERQRGKVTAALEAMSRGLDDRGWCSGDKYSLADIAVGCGLGYLDLRFPDIDWRSPHANLARLFDKLMQRQAFIDTVPPQA
jgi:glutathione S-transferase